MLHTFGRHSIMSALFNTLINALLSLNLITYSGFPSYSKEYFLHSSLILRKVLTNFSFNPLMTANLPLQPNSRVHLVPKFL